MRPAIQAIIVLIVLAFISLNAQAQRIDVITINPDSQPPPEGTDTTRRLYATYRDGRVDSVVNLRWDQMYRLWFKEIATEWSPAIGSGGTTTDLDIRSDVIVKTLKLDGLLPGRILVLSGPTQLALTPKRLREITINGRESDETIRSTFNGAEFVVEYRSERIYFPDGRIKEIISFDKDKQPQVSRRVYERTFDSTRSMETVMIMESKNGGLAIIDSEVYIYRNGLIEQATIGYGLDRADVSHVRMYFSGWHWQDTVVRIGRFTGLDYGGNAYDTIRRQKWVDGAWVSDGVTIHEYKDSTGQLSYTFESHREGAQGVVAWGKDSIWYYPNGDLRRHDHYEFNITLDKPYWTAEYDNTYLKDGRLASSTYYYSGDSAWTDYLFYSDLASVNKQRNPTDLLRIRLVGNVLSVDVGEDGNHALQVFDLLGKLFERSTAVGTQLTLDVSDYPPGVYFIRVDDRQGSFIKN